MKTAVPTSLTKDRASAVSDQKREGRSDQGERSDRPEIEAAQSNSTMIYTGVSLLREKERKKILTRREREELSELEG